MNPLPSSAPIDFAQLDRQLRHLSVLQDKDAIRELTAAYNSAWDDGLTDDWVALFTPDGVFAIENSPDVVGAEALRQFSASQRDGGFVHSTTDHAIEVHGDTATQACRLILSRRSPTKARGSAQWVTTGRYTDELCRTPEGWRFARRTFVPDAGWE